MGFRNIISILLFFPSVLCAEEAVTLTFDMAAQKLFQCSPTLKISASNVHEKDGQWLQSSLYPNPIFSYSVENVFGNKRWRGWRAAESRYEIAQPIETCGKRAFRSKVAGFQFYAAQAGYEATVTQQLNQLLKAFVSVAAAQELLSLAEEQKRISKEIFNIVTDKVDAGKVSLMQKNKAEIAFSHSEIFSQKANTDLDVAKERLALLWGETCPDFDDVAYPFFEVDIPINWHHCLARVQDNPELVKSQFEQLAAQQNLNFEKAEQVPDILVLVGYKTERECGEQGMILGVSLPLAIFNRNQGNIETARAIKAQSYDEYASVRSTLEAKLGILHKEWVRAYGEVDLLRSTVLRVATQSFEFATEGYREGKFEYLDMLDSQQTLFEVKGRYIQALLNYHQRHADIQYLNTKT